MWWKIVTLHILLAITHVGSQQRSPFRCKSPALSKCSCGVMNYDRQQQYVVNCTNTGFTDTIMLEDLPEETQVIIFAGNHISELPWNIFGQFKDLSSLKTIDMTNNGIREIKGKTYHHVTNVERLILNHNNISISSQGNESLHHSRVFSNFGNLLELHLTNAFADYTDAALANDLHDIFVNSNLSKLFKIHLEQNEIKSFKDEFVFCDLPSLMDLYLGDNNIPALNFNITCIKQLRFLDLENNNITQLSQQDLSALDRMSSPHRNTTLIIDIKGNPLKCNIAARHLYDWMHKSTVIVRNRELIQCNKSKYGMEYILNLKNFVESKATRINRAVSVLVVLMTIILMSIFAVYVHLSRDKLRQRLEPLLEVVSRKVRYTTIESQADV